MNIMERKNTDLIKEFDRYVRENPEFADTIPQNAVVIMQVEEDEVFNTWSSELAKGYAEKGETSGSDYDCLVVVDDASEEVKDIIDEVAGDTLYEYNAVFSAFPVSQEKLNHDKYSPLFININKEGITL